MKNTVKSLICLLLCSCTLLSACGRGGNNKTTTTDKKEEATTSSSLSNNQNPTVGGFADQSIAVGETLKVTLPTDKECSFFLTTTAAEITESKFDSTKKETELTISGKIPGSATLVGLTGENSVKTATVRVYAPAADGKVERRSDGAIYGVSSDNSPASEVIEKAFDKNLATKWVLKENTGYITVSFPDGAAYPISKYSIASANDDEVRDPKSWTLYGSVDGKTWIKLDSQENASFDQRRKTYDFTFENDTAYCIYKLDITENNGGSYLQLSEFALFEVGKAGTPEYSGPTAPASNATLTIDGATSFFEGDSANLSVKASGEVIFVTSSDTLVLEGQSYDSASGTTKVDLSAKGNVTDAEILALCKSDLKFATAKVNAIGEGSFLNVSQEIDAVTRGYDKDGNQVTVTALTDNSRTSTANVNGSYLRVEIALSKPTIVNKYALVCGANHDIDPKAWKFFGSNDKESWTELDSREDETFEGKNLKRIFTTENKSAYSYYKLEITESVNGTKLGFAELQLLQEGKYPSSWAIGEFVKLDDVNPVITPNSYDKFLDPISNKYVYWSEKALYNPGAVVKDGVVCILYRSQDNPLVSRVGLAVSLSGTSFENLKEPVLYPDDSDPYYQFEVGGGCEDPRIVKSGEDGLYYMYYTAYDRNSKIARLFVAVSPDLIHWEKKGNFIGDAYNGKYKNFRTKSGAVVCDLVGEEFIARRLDDGKYWIYYGEGEIYAATSDDLIHWTPIEENGKMKVLMKGRAEKWDLRLVEPGPQAIYSEFGILMIYNGANNTSGGANGDQMLVHNAYCPGAVLFDAHDPTKILKRSETYFMYPEKDYELEGLVNNVCFVEGLIFFKGSWYLYYGTADSRLAVAKYTPPKRDDSALEQAIEAAESVSSPSAELKKWTKVAKEAKLSAYYTQAQVDDIVSRINALIK